MQAKFISRLKEGAALSCNFWTVLLHQADITVSEQCMWIPFNKMNVTQIKGAQTPTLYATCKFITAFTRFPQYESSQHLRGLFFRTRVIPSAAVSDVFDIPSPCVLHVHLTSIFLSSPF
jgi:hypothetical protein